VSPGGYSNVQSYGVLSPKSAQWGVMQQVQGSGSHDQDLGFFIFRSPGERGWGGRQHCGPGEATQINRGSRACFNCPQPTGYLYQYQYLQLAARLKLLIPTCCQNCLQQPATFLLSCSHCTSDPMPALPSCTVCHEWLAATLQLHVSDHMENILHV
jgi:hypothetical protein